MASASCQTGPGKHGYNFCGAHWKLSKLPVKFVLNPSGMPSTLNQLLPGQATQFEQAAQQAANTWDSAAPAAGTGTRPVACASTKIICIASISNLAVVASDGVNVIRWDAIGESDVAARTYITPGPGGTITDVDIVLNSLRPSGETWYWAGAPLLTGVATGAVAYFCHGVCPDSLDVQSILTHELGHAIGLLHPNAGAASTWPNDAEDAPDYNLVMYERYYPNNSTQRALGWGDLAGLNIAMEASLSDP